MTNPQENVVWITGASSGIGKSMAFEWAKLGYKVVLSSRRKELLDEVATNIRQSGGEALVLSCDIMDETAIENTVQQIILAWGRLDVVIANAGFGVFGSLEKLTAKDWNRQLQGNVTGLALTVKYALPHLKKKQWKNWLSG
jgi:NADP-dependent 3-hydroxy acid dehydrogenase YdfG